MEKKDLQILKGTGKLFVREPHFQSGYCSYWYCLLLGSGKIYLGSKISVSFEGGLSWTISSEFKDLLMGAKLEYCSSRLEFQNGVLLGLLSGY